MRRVADTQNRDADDPGVGVSHHHRVEGNAQLTGIRAHVIAEKGAVAARAGSRLLRRVAMRYPYSEANGRKLP
jgi:hypothetical protein